jgi:hypothetical protein
MYNTFAESSSVSLPNLSIFDLVPQRFPSSVPTKSPAAATLPLSHEIDPANPPTELLAAYSALPSMIDRSDELAPEATGPFPVNFDSALPFSGVQHVRDANKWPTALAQSLVGHSQLVLKEEDTTMLVNMFVRDIRNALAFRVSRSKYNQRSAIVHCLPSIFTTFLWERLMKDEKKETRGTMEANLSSQNRVAKFFGRSALVRIFKSGDRAIIAPRAWAMGNWSQPEEKWRGYSALEIHGGEYVAVLDLLPDGMVVCFQSSEHYRTMWLGQHVRGRIGVVPTTVLTFEEPFCLRFSPSRGVLRLHYSIWRFNPAGVLQGVEINWSFLDWEEVEGDD